MSENKNTFYVTTPIYYVNAKPHLGSLYSTLLADVAARWNKLQGKETFFLTGTDEHGQKVAEAAEAAGKQPKEFLDGLVGSFKKLWPEYEIEPNHFIRTTDDYHVKAVQKWIKKLKEQGDIYKALYEGWYDTSSEAFLTDKDLEFKEDGQPPISTLSGKPARWVSEDCYFFRLSAYQDKLLDFYKKNPNFITPSERINEVIAFVEGGLKDLSVSRKTITWGIPFPGDEPGDEQHVTYVWADALNNYITAIGYGDDSRIGEFEKWWPADLQVMGKDIVRFHAIYWPAFLMASGLPLPKKLLVHGWIKVDGQKMSKSLGNAVDPQQLAQEYGVEPVRYYLTRYMAITQDSTFSSQDLEQKISSDLANDLGNLLNRMLTLALKNGCEQVEAPSEWGPDEQALFTNFAHALKEFEAEMQGYFFHRAYAALWKFINAVNAYFHAQEPWKMAKAQPERFEQVIAATCTSLYAIALILSPLLPKKMAELLDALGQQYKHEHDYITELRRGEFAHTFTLKQVEPLFKKYEITKDGTKESMDQTQENSAKEAEASNYIAIDDLIKVELLVGLITEVEDLEKSDKLYRMTVDFGDKGIRHICAGIKKDLAIDDLKGKKSVFVYNLKPRKMLGLESQGMMLITKNDQGKILLTQIDDSVPAGTRLQ